MQNMFQTFPRSFEGREIISVGPKSDQFHLIKDLISLKSKDKSIFVIEGLWGYRKIVNMGIHVRLFCFCPDYISSEEDLELVKGFIRIADESAYVSDKLCARMSDRDSTDGFFVVADYPTKTVADIPLKDNNLIIITDGLDKPGNIGTIIRSAEAAGCDAVISVNTRVPLSQHRLIKASLGGSLTLPVISMDVNDCIQWLKDNGFTLYITNLKSARWHYEESYQGRAAIVAGNEIRGISDIWNQCDVPHVNIKIPMFGQCDSLNVGFASTMVAYEASLKQKGLIK